MALPTTLGSLSSSNGMQCTTQPFISSGGNVYVIGVTTTATYNIGAYKATDPTSSFSNVGTNFSTTSLSALTALAAVQDGDNIHVVYRDSNAGGNQIRYAVFSMSSDSWTTTNELVVGSLTSAGSTTQYPLAISIRSDGDVIVLYNGPTGASMGTDYDRVKYARRESGSWTVNVAVDNAGAANWYAGTLVRGSSDRMHLYFVSDTPAAYQRTLTSANSLQSFPSAFDAGVSTSLIGLIQQGASYDDGGTQRVRTPCVDSTSELDSVTLDSADSPTPSVTDDIIGASSFRVAVHNAAFSADSTTLWCTFVDNSASDIYTLSNADDAGWDTPASFHTGTCTGVKTNIYTRGSTLVLAMVLNDSGIKYHEKTLSSGTTDAAFSMAATATATWSGRSTASSNLSASALASVTWTGRGIYPAALSAAAAASVTWGGAAVAGATAAEWSSAAAASLTWQGTGLYPAALSAAAAASLTWNGAAVATSNLSATSVASLTWNGTSTAASALSAQALAALTWNGTGLYPAAFDSDAAATLTWNGAGVAVVSAAWESAATASLTWNGTATASADLDADALASLTWNGRSTASANLDADAAATLTWNGSSIATSNWSATATASVAWNGAAVLSASWSAAAAAALTWNGEASAVASGAWSASGSANLAAVGASTASTDLESDALASLTWNGRATAGGVWSATAVGSMTWNGRATASAYIDTDIDALATLRMVGDVVPAQTEAVWSAAAAGDLSAAGASTAAAATSMQATAVATFTGADAEAVVEERNIDGRLLRKQVEIERMDELEEEDIMFIMSAVAAYLEQNHVYH